jgi:hypothetical protein
VVSASADEPIFSGRFSRDSVEVGDQVEYIMDVEVDRATYMQFPSYGDGLKWDSDKAKISTYTKYDEDALEFLSDYDTTPSRWMVVG